MKRELIIKRAPKGEESIIIAPRDRRVLEYSSLPESRKTALKSPSAIEFLTRYHRLL